MSELPLEIWGAVEAAAVSSIETFVGFERIASLGLKRLRVPISPQTHWSAADGLLRGLRHIGVRPMIALRAPARNIEQLARTAARRYPWVFDFSLATPDATPSGDDVSAYRALLDEIAALHDAIGALRAENAAARLIASAPLAKTYAPETFSDRADYENDRRLLALDLLCGTLERNPSMQRKLAECGLHGEARNESAVAYKPDLLEFSYDVTNERWMDHRGALPAVGVCVESIAGTAPLLGEMWDRYGLPLALAAALHGSSEQQVRWLRDLHSEVVDLRSGGVDVRALTVPVANAQASAAIDLRAQRPRETAVANYTRFLSGKTTIESPVVDGPGWWRLPSRIEFAPVMRDARLALIPPVANVERRRPIVIIGTDDPLADVVAGACRMRGLAHRLWPEPVANSEMLAAKLVRADAWAVFDCTAADGAWLSELSENEQRLSEHFGGIAHACRQAGLPLVAISSPLVFDGGPFLRTEDDATHPKTGRGACYVEIEELLKIAVPKSLILRCGIPFGGATRFTWHDAALLRMLQGARACIFSDYVSAIHRDDLARVALDLLIDGERGIVHAYNPGESNAVEILDTALRRLRSGARIERIAEAANRRRYMLASARIAPLRPLALALEDWTDNNPRLQSAS